MAPLSLPELRDGSIPAKNRRAMVKDLPRGTLDWSGDSLEHTLEDCLEFDQTTGSVWSATAYVLASEQRPSWLENLGSLIERSADLRTKPQPMFWNTVECGSYVMARANPSDRELVEHHLNSLVSQFSGTEAGVGLRRVLETITQISSSVPT